MIHILEASAGLLARAMGRQKARRGGVCAAPKAPVATGKWRLVKAARRARLRMMRGRK
ncbi:MAG: hypothetical protein IE922_01595 [Sphingomonadales bacterium]|nr:hypothetical protein [Sphingomonadales bacterium]